jgi:hypothetical protein
MHTFILEPLEPIVTVEPRPFILKSNPFPSVRNVLLHSQQSCITMNDRNISHIEINPPLLELDYMRSVTRVHEEKRRLMESERRETDQDQRLDAVSPARSTCSAIESEHSDFTFHNKKKRKNKKTEHWFLWNMDPRGAQTVFNRI